MEINRETIRRYRWPIIFLVIAIILFLARFIMNAQNPDYYQKIDAEQAATILEENDDVLIFDLSPDQDFLLGHIDGAIQVSAREVDVNFMEDITDGNRDQIIMICAKNGRDSKKLARKLANSKYTNVYDLGERENWESLID